LFRTRRVIFRPYQLCYSQPCVELFLNLVWIATSVCLIAGWLWSTHRSRLEFQWTPLIALAVLIVVLFPVISITDDMLAMSTPAELEHMMRCSEAPLEPVAILGLMWVLAAIAMAVLEMAASYLSFRIRPRTSVARLLVGFVRASGVRPPPSARLLAL
jgi:hypothetical protein